MLHECISILVVLMSIFMYIFSVPLAGPIGGKFKGILGFRSQPNLQEQPVPTSICSLSYGLGGY